MDISCNCSIVIDFFNRGFSLARVSMLNLGLPPCGDFLVDSFANFILVGWLHPLCIGYIGLACSSHSSNFQYVSDRVALFYCAYPIFFRMDIYREGTSTNKSPLLNGTNYAYWKAGMVAFLKAIDLKVWKFAVNGYSLPIVTANGITGSKSEEHWTKDKELTVTYNSRALNAIYNGVSMSEFRRISTCTTAKEAWHILQMCMKGLTLSNSKDFRSYKLFLKP
eukprot:TRINITY_DN14247_c1_g1_i3.p1 TRINITY_DN14247_c1_g1~~TRINITY_DN14247_c1_g1_i3.p1  ORF type:complete len:222 (-),score=14.17 TRINITY_DN14247_c1_g1_i3:2719-3384(-)